MRQESAEARMLAAGMRQIKELLRRLVPPQCLLCGGNAEVSGLCPPCTEDLPRVLTACPRCGAAYSGRGDCGQCQRRAPAFDLTLAPFCYARPVDTWVKLLKYRGKLHYARTLGELLAADVARRMTHRPDLIVPVPLHRSRLRRRGFNQALEIARPVARMLARPIETRRVVRSRSTASQAELPLSQRRANLRRAFTLTTHLPATSVAIVDDVVTSGETAQALARCLRDKGIEHIQVWAVARA